MAADLMKYLEAQQPGDFTPQPYYGAKEDSLTIYFDEAESYAKRIDELLTLFLSLETEALIGFQVKGIRRRLQRLGNFGLTIDDGKVHLALMFHILAFFAKAPEQRQSYFELSERTKNLEVELSEELVGA